MKIVILLLGAGLLGIFVYLLLPLPDVHVAERQIKSYAATHDTFTLAEAFESDPPWDVVYMDPNSYDVGIDILRETYGITGLHDYDTDLGWRFVACKDGEVLIEELVSRSSIFLDVDETFPREKRRGVYIIDRDTRFEVADKIGRPNEEGEGRLILRIVGE
jgi:hypothetical protein